MDPPPRIAWLLQSGADLPADDVWLAPAERETQDRLRLPPRRAQWRLGRWTAKVALARWLDLPRGAFARLELRVAADGAPEPWADGAPLPMVLSLSHCGEQGLVALADAPLALGADLERVEARSAAFVRDYFTATEQRWLAAAALAGGAEALAERATLLWSAKESALKALRTGLRRDTRSVEVVVPPALPVVPGAAATAPPGAGAAWAPLLVQDLERARRFSGAWCRSGDQVLTVVAEPGGVLDAEALGPLAARQPGA